MYKVFLVEDDEGIASGIKTQAAMWSMDVAIAHDFTNVIKEFVELQPHIVLMDISLPFYNGYYWCTQIRNISKTPIVFISSASDNMNIVMAINIGADDFIAKPFDMSVLIAKLQAVLRRTYDFASGISIIEHRGALLDTAEDTLTYKGSKIPLSKNEFRILKLLMEQRGKVVSREKLMESLWQTDQYIDDNTLTVNVNRLRKKLEQSGLDSFINTKFGVGYIIDK